MKKIKMPRASAKKRAGSIRVAFSSRTGDFVKPGLKLLKLYTSRLGMSVEKAEQAIQMAFENLPRAASGLRATAHRKLIKAEMKNRLAKTGWHRHFISEVRLWAEGRGFTVSNKLLYDIRDELQPHRPRQSRRVKTSNRAPTRRQVLMAQQKGRKRST